MIWLALYLLILVKLKGFFSTLKHGNPFIYENAKRIRLMGIIILIAELLRVLKDFSVVVYLKNIITSSTVNVFTLPFEFYWEYLRLDLIFIGILVIILSEIFRLGAKIQEEQKLTI